MSFIAAGGSLAAIIASMGEAALAVAPTVAAGAGATAAAGTGAALGAGAGALAGTGAALGATEAGLAGAGGVAGETIGSAAPLAAQSLPEVAASGPGSITESMLGPNSMINPMAPGNAPGMNLPQGIEGADQTGSWLDTLGGNGYGGPAEGGGIMTPMEGITGEAPMEKAMADKLGLNSLKGLKDKFDIGKTMFDMLSPKPQPAPQLPQPPAKKQLTTPASTTSAEMQSILQSLPPELRQMYQQLLQ